MSEAIKELQERKHNVNCMYALIDELMEKHNLEGSEQKLELTFAIYG